ncbi:MAG: hypothetical protein AAF206_25865, partial [Bacteroidota bacterium]
MRFPLLIIALLACTACHIPQSTPTFLVGEDLQHKSPEQIRTFLNDLSERGQLPYFTADSAFILYQSETGPCYIAGDINGWHPEATRMTQLGETDLWYWGIKAEPN